MGRTERFRLLVVDDNPNIHQDFRKILGGDSEFYLRGDKSWEFDEEEEESEFDSYDLDFAIQGQQAVELASQSLEEGRPFAVAFVDMRMPPGWDGLETIQRLWDVDPHIQVVIVTAYTSYRREDIVDRLGNTDKLLFIRKPFDIVEIEQLAATLSKKWIDSRKVAERTTALENAQQALQQKATELEKVDKDKSAVFANISREIWRPLNRIDILAGLLLENKSTNLTTSQLENAAAIQKYAKDVLTLIDSILELEKNDDQ